MRTFRHWRRHLAALAGASASFAWLAGCASIPEGRYAVDEVVVEGTDQLDEDDVESAMATRENPRLFGLVEGFMNEYSIFDRYVLQEDLARVQRYYQRRGFYDTQVLAGAVTVESDDEVAIEILVDERSPVLVERVRIEGFTGEVADLLAPAQEIVDEELPVGARFDEDRYISTEARIKRLLTDRGYAFARVERRVIVDIVRLRADVRIIAKPDRPATFGDVTIEGAGELPQDMIRAALGIEPGAPYSTRRLEEAQADAFELGVFAAVELQPELPTPPPADRVVPVKITVTPAKLQRIRLGGGITIDSLKSDIHLLIGWEGRNFFGGMRRFSVELVPAVVFVPLRIDNFVVPERVLPAGTLRVEFRQPGFLEERTTGYVRPRISATPILLKTDQTADDPILGYAESFTAIGVYRAFGRRLYVELSQNAQYALPFPYAGDLDPALQDVLLLYPELVTALDFRDDKIHPHRGAYIAHTFQTSFWRDGRDFKFIPEVRGYAPIADGITLAGRTKIGLLFPQNYGGDLVASLTSPFEGPDRERRIHELQILHFRGLYSGGADSNRGYPYGGVGPHGTVPYLNPLSGICDRSQPDFEEDRCLSPVGGLTLWEASLELRFVIDDPLSGAVFCDASDVSPEQVDIRLGRPHMSCGLGARYDTPVGPIRLDIGYRIPGLQVLEGSEHPLDKEPSDIFGVPIAVALGIGEAF